MERDIYAHTAAQEAGVSPDSVLMEAKRARENRRRQQQRQLEREALQPERRLQPKAWELRYTDPASAAAEERLLALVLDDRDSLDYARARVEPGQFSSPFLAGIYQKALDRRDRGLEPEAAACMNDLTDDERRQLTDILGRQVRTGDTRRALDDYIAKITFCYEKRTAPQDDSLLIQAALRRRQGKEE